jgi:tetratricopeptide (TPR) repeat protein
MDMKHPKFETCNFCGASAKLENIAEHKLKLHNKDGSLTVGDFSKEEFDALYDKAAQLAVTGKLDKSIELFNLGVAVDKRNEGAWNDFGMALSHSGKLDAALKAYDTALEIAPDSAKAWYNKGNLLAIKMKRYADALECYDNALKYNPELMLAWYNKGVMHTKAGENEKAMECFDHAISLNDKYFMAWFAKGQILESKGEAEEAEKCFAKAYRLNPSYTKEAFRALAEDEKDFYYDSGMKEKAKKDSSQKELK